MNIAPYMVRRGGRDRHINCVMQRAAKRGPFIRVVPVQLEHAGKLTDRAKQRIIAAQQFLGAHMQPMHIDSLKTLRLRRQRDCQGIQGHTLAGRLIHMHPHSARGQGLQSRPRPQPPRALERGGVRPARLGKRRPKRNKGPRRPAPGQFAAVEQNSEATGKLSFGSLHMHRAGAQLRLDHRVNRSLVFIHEALQLALIDTVNQIPKRQRNAVSLRMGMHSPDMPRRPEVARVMVHRRMPPAIAGLGLIARDPGQSLDPPEKGGGYCHWWQVATHDARYRRPPLYLVNTKLVIFTLCLVVAGSYLVNVDDKWFKAQQKKVGVTAEDIAREFGRDRSIVSRVYVGRQKMTLELAEAFAKVLQVDIATVLEKAGVGPQATITQLRPGFSDSDAAPWIGQDRAPKNIAAVLGLDKPGVDIWQAKSRAMCLQGILPDDFLLVDTHAAERSAPGDVVIAQLYNNANGSATTVIRRYEPPVLVAASSDPEDQRVHIVDGNNVVIRGKVVASWRM